MQKTLIPTISILTGIVLLVTVFNVEYNVSEIHLTCLLITNASVIDLYALQHIMFINPSTEKLKKPQKKIAKNAIHINRYSEAMKLVKQAVKKIPTSIIPHILYYIKSVILVAKYPLKNAPSPHPRSDNEVMKLGYLEGKMRRRVEDCTPIDIPSRITRKTVFFMIG